MEVERARVTRLLSPIYEHENKISDAAKTLCELQVETYGSMSRAEKVDFLLEQVRLCIAAGDWLTAENTSRKISTRWFNSSDSEDSEDPTASTHLTKLSLKLRFPPFLRF